MIDIVNVKVFILNTIKHVYYVSHLVWLALLLNIVLIVIILTQVYMLKVENVYLVNILV